MSNKANIPFMGPTGVAPASKLVHILKNKKRLLDHVLYEMYMFLWTTKSLKELLEKGINWENSSQYNAYYIAQKCSLRNILEFFSSSHRCHSDIYFGKIYKIPNDDVEIINGGGALDSYLLFSKKYFKKYLDKVNGIKYYGRGITITDIVNKTISHLTDKRFDWGSENLEQIINGKEINKKVIQDIKNVIKIFINSIESCNSNENLYYSYNDGNKRKSKNLSDELQDNDIKTLLVDINSLIKD